MSLILLLIVSLVSTIKSTNFYFWHDDFSVLYVPRTGECIFSWPYQSYCTIFSFLDSLFNYSPVLYFSLGFLLFLVSVITMYLLLRIFLPRNMAYLTAGIYATGYIGAGVFLESYSSITSFASLGLFMISIVLLERYVKNRKRVEKFIYFLFIFILSIIILQARSVSYIVPPLLLLCFRKTRIRTLFIETIIVVIAFVYFYLPTGLSNNLAGNDIATLVINTNYSVKIPEFFNLIGRIFLPFVSTDNNLIYIGLGALFFLLSIFYILLNRQNVTVLKLGLFAIVWMFVMYAPYAIRSSGFLHPTHRYLIFTSPGILMLWAVFYKVRYWKWLSIILIVSFMVLNYRYLQTYEIESQRRANFYNKLHDFIPQLPSNAVLYFDFSPSFKHSVDYLRVGYTPAESAIGTEFGVKYDNLKIFVDSSRMQEYIEKGELADRPLYTFVYDQEGLNNIKTLPSKISLNIKATLDDLRLPFSNCPNCIKMVNVENGLKILNSIKSIKNNVTVISNNSGEDSEAKWLVDNNVDTYWLGNRQEWFENNLPVLNLSLPVHKQLSGFYINKNNNLRYPTNVEVNANGKKLTVKTEEIGNFIQFTFESQLLNQLEIRIISTASGDSPIIYELYFLTPGYEKITLEQLQILEMYPAGLISTQRELAALKSYISNGVHACIKWKTEDFGSGEVPFTFFINSKEHTYSINMPSMGGRTPQIEVGCINLPIRLSVQ